jgi:hypothetical protein
MIRIAFAISLLANVLLGAGLYHAIDQYGSLLIWACDNGNGGQECGED